MIPDSYRVRSFSSYYDAKGKDTLQAIQSYCLDVYENIHTKELSFSSCGVDGESEYFYSIYSEERKFSNTFIPLYISQPYKTPPEVSNEQTHYGIVSDSWVMAIDIVKTLLSEEEFGLMLKEKDEFPPFVIFYMILTSERRLIDMKSLLIINKLFRRDYARRYTVKDVLIRFFGYTAFSPTPYSPKNRNYQTAKQYVQKFFDIDAFIEIVLVPEIDSRLRVFIEEKCVVPFLAAIPVESTYKIIFGSDSLFFVKFFVFLRTCVTYFKIMRGQLHPKRNEKAIKNSYTIETGVGFIERGVCSSFDLYRDVGIPLFGLIHTGLKMD